ncbi:hypothetical protein AVEN_273269-1 [Araneus ventricosus]|uniref:Uncharacterized protein n=1 Tax=Araneus ventricosus TaxID=182803 RepID=A0A4Y2I247_ARAVE|nr:hypothetical protein AVEN_273269-1 [Araneus ventricosus]
MAALLAVHIKKEQRAVIRFLWLEVLQASRLILDSQHNTGIVLYYGDSTPKRSITRLWLFYGQDVPDLVHPWSVAQPNSIFS